MANTCTICAHPQRAEIETQMTAGVSLRSIALHHGTTAPSLRRHRDNCLAGAVQAAQQAQQVVVGKTILAQIEELQGATLRILKKAERTSKLTPAVLAIGAARQNLELQAKLTGQLQTNVNVLIHPDWVKLKEVLITVLEPHPLILEQVTDAISKLDS